VTAETDGQRRRIGLRPGDVTPAVGATAGPGLIESVW
jgi:hypothetical protein